MTGNQGSIRRFRDRGIRPDGRDISGSAYVQRIVVDRRIADLIAEASLDRRARSAAARPWIGDRLGAALGGLARGAARSAPPPVRPHADPTGRPACIGPSSTP